jgi:4-hydroxybenzoate polyprenyltransferase
MRDGVSAEASLPIASPPAALRRGRTLRLVVEGMRPLHWSKNAFVLAAVVFSGKALSPTAELKAWTVTLAFCLASGAAYLVNDAVDAESDRHNPRTASRPIARGDLAVRTAVGAAVGATVLSLILAALVEWTALAALAGFIGLQFAYSKWLKHVLFIDVMAIAAGFVLRALGGLAPLHVGISPWLLNGVALLTLFLALAKRRSEAAALGGVSYPSRPVLDNYSIALIDQLIMVVTPTTLVFYTLYSMIGARTEAMLGTVPFVLYGIFRVLYLIHHQSALTEDPAVLVWRDRPLLICVLLWGLTAATIAAISP